MAWYLSEVISDLSFIKPVLAFYADKPDAVKPVDELISLLHDLLIYLDHIETEDIPNEHEDVLYHWLAEDSQRILTNFKFLQSNDEGQYTITEQGSEVISLSEHEILQQGLENWGNDQSIKPFSVLKELLSDAASREEYPCNGLFLLEITQLLIKLNEQPRSQSAIEDARAVTYSIRDEVFADNKTDDLRVDTLLYTDHLWNTLKNSSEHDYYILANYKARATTMLMMHSDDLIYEKTLTNYLV